MLSAGDAKREVKAAVLLVDGVGRWHLGQRQSLPMASRPRRRHNDGLWEGGQDAGSGPGRALGMVSQS